MSTTYKNFLVEERGGRFYVPGEWFDPNGYDSMDEATKAIDVDELENLIAQGHIEVMLDREKNK
jgi:reverse gyrase